jgi:hypothetical protein
VRNSAPMMRRALLVLVAALALLVTGCVSDPSMKLYGARLAGASPQGISLNMTMAVENHNSFDVMVRDVRCDVMLANHIRLAPVVVSPNQWLPAGRTTLVQIPVTVPWNLVGPVLTATVGSPHVTYKAWGSANVTATRLLEVDYDDYKISQEGKFYRSELMSAAGRGFFGGP